MIRPDVQTFPKKLPFQPTAAEQPARELAGEVVGPHEEFAEIPKPCIKKSSWWGKLAWLVPVFALGGALYYANVIADDHGRHIVVTIDDANSIEAGKTKVRSHGVDIGKVTAVELSDDREHARVHIRLNKKSDDFARAGSRYWLVRADLSGGDFSGINTIVAGVYFESLPGDGETQAEFRGMRREPVTEHGGFHLQLFADNLDHLDPGTPVRYRGIEVGAVARSHLSDDGTNVVIGVTIDADYADLVRRNSVFWIESPAEVKGGLLSGVDVKVGPLKSFLSGGIGFATPDNPTELPAIDGWAFVLRKDKPDGVDAWRPSLKINRPKIGGRHDRPSGAGSIEPTMAKPGN